VTWASNQRRWRSISSPCYTWARSGTRSQCFARSWPAVQKQDKPVSFAGDQIGGVFGLDISHVEWNKDAFESLAIDSKSRDLIEALVTNHVEPEVSVLPVPGPPCRSKISPFPLPAIRSAEYSGSTWLVTGFNLRRKKWFDLSVDRISHVEWNKDAFESLARHGRCGRLRGQTISCAVD
jgi:hypothetical protein